MTDKNGVSLETYIQEVCEQIVRGVLNAQKNDEIGKYVGISQNTNYTDIDHSYVTEVKFDVSAEVNTNISGKGKVGITIAGVAGEAAKSEVAANRISFHVPVAIPLPDEIKAKHKSDRDKVNQDLGF